MSRVCLETIEVQNFLSIGYSKLKLTNGLFLITGENKDEFQSNGAGKTSVIESIVWGLYGQTIRDGGDEFNRYSKDDKKKCSVIIHMSVDGIEYRIDRQKTKKSSTQVRLLQKENEEYRDISSGTNKATQVKIDELLRKDYKLFLQTNIFNSKSESHCTMSDSGIKKFFDKILCMSMWKEYEDSAKAVKVELEKVESELKLEVRFTEKKILEIEEHIEILRQEIPGYGDKLKEVGSQLNQVKQEVVRLTSKRDEQELSIQADEHRVDTLKKQISDIDEKIHELSREYLTRHSDTSIAVSGWVNKVKEMTSAITHIQNILSGSRCIHCDKLPFKEDWEVDKLPEQEQNLKTQIAHAEKEIERIKKGNEIECRTIEHRKQGLCEAVERLRLLKKNLEHEASSKKSNFAIVVDVLKKKSEEKEVLLEKFQAAGVLEKHTKKMIARQEEMLQKIREELDFDIKKLKIQSMKIRDAEILIEAYGNRGVKALLLNGIVDPLNRISNEYLKMLGAKTFGIKFSASKELKSGEVRNIFDISVLDYELQAVIPYAAYSGGESKRIDIAIILALLTVSSNTMDIGLLVLDEVIDATDLEGAEAIVEILKSIAEDRTILMITHNDSVKDLIENNIHCIKSNKITEVSNGSQWQAEG